MLSKKKNLVPEEPSYNNKMLIANFPSLRYARSEDK